MSAAQDALRFYVSSSRERLQKLLERLNWTEEGVRQLHHAPPAAVQSEKEDVEQLPCICQDAPKHTVQLNATLLQNILGPPITPAQLINNTVEDLQTNFSAEQKLLIYEHVLQQTPRQHVSLDEDPNFAKLVAETKREHKKQRRHRKSKPTLQEEMHQLVELQMQALQQQHNQQQQQQHYRPHPPAVADDWRRHQSKPEHRRRSPRRDSPYRDQRMHRSRRHHERSRSRSLSSSRSRSRSHRRHRHSKSERSRSPRQHKSHKRHKRSRYS